MPSRKIEDCVEALQVAWVDASKAFAQLHPEAQVLLEAYRKREGLAR